MTAMANMWCKSGDYTGNIKLIIQATIIPYFWHINYTP